MKHKWITSLHQPPTYERHGGKSIVASHQYTRRECEGCGMGWVTLGMNNRVTSSAGKFIGSLWAAGYDCGTE